MRKKILLLFLCLAINTFIFSQERVNKKLPQISSKIYGQLQSAIGWLNNPEGQWISRKNRIPKYLTNDFKILVDYEKYALAIDNFISYEIRQITISDTTYNILIKQSKGGYYRYPKIQQDWIKTYDAYYWILDSADLNNLETIKIDSTQTLKIPVLLSGIIDNKFSYSSLLTDIKLDVIKNWGNNKALMKYEQNLCINIKVLSKNEACRFFIYEYSNLHGDYIWGLPGFDDEKVVKNSESNLSKFYFETAFQNFKKFFLKIKTE